MDRRTFVQRTSVAGGLALWTGLAAGAKGADDKPALEKKSVFSLANKTPVRFPGGTLREMAAADFPASPNMSASLMELDAGGLRGLHWHLTAAEIGYVLKGSAVLSVVDAQHNTEVGPLHEGDIFYVPVGFAHGLACLGKEPCKLMSVYDDGITVETNALNATDWIKGERADILSAILKIPGEQLRQSAGQVPLLTKGKPLLDLPVQTHGPATRAPRSFRFPLTKMLPIATSGGTFVQASKADFPMSLTMIASLTILNPRGVREPHWHPNADEWDFVIGGRALVTVFEGADRSATVEIGPGDVSFLKRNTAHAVATVGDEPFHLLSVFNADNFQAIGISGTLIATPDELLARNLGIPESLVKSITKEKMFITSK